MSETLDADFVANEAISSEGSHSGSNDLVEVSDDVSNDKLDPMLLFALILCVSLQLGVFVREIDSANEKHIN